MRKDPTALFRARVLRREATAAEKILWHHLRNRQLGNLKFARQEPIGPYIADFVCRAKKLIIEIDGVTHESPEELAHDVARTEYLVGQGYRVIRFRNEDIFGDLGPVLETIIRACVKAPHPPIRLRCATPDRPQPSPQRGEGK